MSFLSCSGLAHKACKKWDEYDQCVDRRRKLSESAIGTTPRNLSLENECTEAVNQDKAKIQAAIANESVTPDCLKALTEGDIGFQCFKVTSSSGDGYFDKAEVVGEVELKVTTRFCLGEQCCSTTNERMDKLEGEYMTEFSICVEIENDKDIHLKDLTSEMNVNGFLWKREVELLRPGEHLEYEISKHDIEGGDFPKQLYIQAIEGGQIFEAKVYGTPSDEIGMKLCELPKQYDHDETEVKMNVNDKLGIDVRVAFTSDLSGEDCNAEKFDNWQSKVQGPAGTEVAFCVRVENEGESTMEVAFDDFDLQYHVGFEDSVIPALAPNDVVYVHIKTITVTDEFMNDATVQGKPILPSTGEEIPNRETVRQSDHAAVFTAE